MDTPRNIGEDTGAESTVDFGGLRQQKLRTHPVQSYIFGLYDLNSLCRVIKDSWYTGTLTSAIIRGILWRSLDHIANTYRQ